MAYPNIFIVDDNPKFREVVRTYSRISEEFQVVGEATNGAELINCIDNYKVDIILMDINMPVLNGIATTKLLNQKYTPALKIIALSEHSEFEYMQKMIEAGAAGYVIKSALGQHLLDAIHMVLSGGIFFPELTK